MNTGTILCILLSSIFLLLFILFIVLKDKSVLLIAGFNTFTKEERNKYDCLTISKDFRNTFLIWFIIFTIGGLLSYFVSTYVSIVSFVLWIILFIKQLSFNPEKGFEKYKKENL